MYKRSYKRGYRPEEEYGLTTIRDTGVGLARSRDYVSSSKASQPDSELKSFEEIRATCNKTGQYYEDPEFKCEGKSLYYRNEPDGWPNIEWKRPMQICSNPRMFVDGASRMDVIQGKLTDCWLMAAIACLTTRKELFDIVVPPEQSFDNEYYGGIFKFKIWQYGRWVEVFVDDRLPTHDNQLIYMHSDTKNEFWCALLEKAYAKLHGSYEALGLGFTGDALTDFTGGFVESFDLSRINLRKHDDLFSDLLKALTKSALMGCSIWVEDPYVSRIRGSGDLFGSRSEKTLYNGLVVGHAYSITDVRCIKSSRYPEGIQMVRIRNPWGDEEEWNGDWSDRSKQWDTVSEEEKRNIGLAKKDDGEFWMSFSDFMRNFKMLEICYPGMDAYTVEERKNKTYWKEELFEEEWKIGVSAGGSRANAATFWTNPKYRVKVVDPDETDNDDNGTLLISLMQKNRRLMRDKYHRDGAENLSIGYAIYETPDATTILDREFFRDSRRLSYQYSDGRFGFCPQREVSGRYKLKPGHYVIVPSTSGPNEAGKFVLRVYSETKKNIVQPLDKITRTIHIPQPVKPLAPAAPATPATTPATPAITPATPIPPASPATPAPPDTPATPATTPATPAATPATPVTTPTIPTIPAAPYKRNDEANGVVTEGKKAFLRLAGGDEEMDAFQLQYIMNIMFEGQFKFEGFNSNTTRRLVAMKDHQLMYAHTSNMSGKLNFEEFKNLWTDVIKCKKTFKWMNFFNKGQLDSFELRGALLHLGYHVSSDTFSAILLRYGDKEGFIKFDDFLDCYIKLKTVFEQFHHRDLGDGRAKFNMNEFTMLAMYS